MFYGHNVVQAGANGLEIFFLIGLVYLALTIPFGMFARWIEGRTTKTVVRS